MSDRDRETALTVLGIETSCDETAAAVVERLPGGVQRLPGGVQRLPGGNVGQGVILSSIVLSQDGEHQAYGGVVPEIAARAHVSHLDRVIARALADAGTGWDKIDGVAATAGPGLIGGVLVGLMTAKAIALARGLPLIAVNHLEGHALTARLTGGQAFPYLLLLVSGGHTQLLAVEGLGHYRRLGTTIDDALGEAFDKTAKLLGLGFPGGPAVERMAENGDGTRFALPRPLLGRDDCHFSFSGLKTAIRRAAHQLVPLSDGDIADLCASFQAAAGDCVIDRTKRAMIAFKKTNAPASPALVVAGGVAANAALRARLAALADERGFDLVLPPAALCTDNAAMIAWAGAEHLAAGNIDALDAPARARWPLDADAPAATGAGVKA